MVPRESVLVLLGRRPRVLAAILGLLGALGFQPIGFWPAALVSMACLFALIQRSGNAREAAQLGWIFGLTHFTFANFWIATAFTFQAQMPAVLGWIAVPLISLYLAIYPALAAGAARLIGGPRMGWAAAIGFAGCWIIAEWLRSWVFTGFAWNPFGVVLLGGFSRPGLAVLAPWTGTYGLSGLAVLLAGAGAVMLANKLVVPLGLLAAVVTAGMFWPAGHALEGSLPFTLVQPNIPQAELNEPSFYETNYAKAAALTYPNSPGARRIVLWPESGVRDYLEDGYPQRYYDGGTVLGSPAYARARLSRAIGPGGMLMVGAVDLDIENGRAVGARNVISVLDARGDIVGNYAKAHLVPFGEYLALRWLLEPLGATRLVPGALDFLPGPGPRTIDLGGWGKAGMQLCYEIIFSGHVVDPQQRPDYIFNPSNDGWFGAFGPPQHLAQARLRAVEEGLPVLRSTTSGISAVVDARGVVRAHVTGGRAGRLEGFVPPARAPTLFARLGNLLPLGWAALLLLAAMALRRRTEGWGARV